MGKSLEQVINSLPTDILVQMNAKLVPFLAQPLQEDDAYLYRLIENKRVLFIFNTSPDILKQAADRGIRSAIIIKTGESRRPNLRGGDVLMLKDNNEVYETKLIPHLSKGFGVRLGVYPHDLSPLSMRILSFFVVVDSLPQDVAHIQNILDHLLVCSTANL
ncbi:MAG: hypothetical protein ACRC9L_08105 [Brevinema sp.]